MKAPIAFVIVASLALAGLVGLSAARAGQAVDGSGTVDVAGVTREYLSHVPASYDGRHAVALVLNFHGGLGTPEGQIKLSDMNPVADAHGFIVVYPRGIDKHWNDGRSEETSQTDDVAFVATLIDKLAADYRIDPRRVYATGMSNGAIFSFRLACELSDKIAAIAPVAGAMPANLPGNCGPQATSIMMINGNADPLVPYDGGHVGGRGAYAGDVVGVEDSLQFWARTDECFRDPAGSDVPHTAADDATTTARTEFIGCRYATSVQLYTVNGGGHTWPGGWQYLPAALIGPTSRDFNASEAMWQFFAAHPHS